MWRSSLPWLVEVSMFISRKVTRPRRLEQLEQPDQVFDRATEARQLEHDPAGGAQMAWIEIINEDQAGPDLRDLYEPIVDATTGRVDEILRIHSLHPAGLAAHTALYKSAMRSTPTLRKVEREMIALVVSVINDCHY
jgi:hypothetical protein